MKSKLIAFLFALLATAAVAQDDERQLPVEGDMGFTLNLNGLINNISLNAPLDPAGNQAIFFRYYLKDDLALRAGFGVNAVGRNVATVDSVGATLVDFDSTYSKTDVHVAFGIEKHFVGSRRLDPYAGANLRVGLLGKENMKSDRQTTDTLGVNSFKIDEDRAGGSTIGIDLSIGFNYFFAKRLAVGAEYTFGFGTTRRGGDYSRIINDQPATGANTVTREIGSDIQRNTTLDVNSTAGITLSWFFARS